VLYGLDGVQDAAVVGVVDEVFGEAIKAFVVLRAGTRYSEKDTIRHCHWALESFMVAKHVAIVAELPKTDTGKIKKTGLQ
jgi:long-chain acyl-CoA synthetase